MNTIIAIVAALACIVVLTKPWGNEYDSENKERR